jgi:hypothetical protein
MEEIDGNFKMDAKFVPGRALWQYYTGWCRETVKFEIIMKKKRRKLTKLYLILKMCSTRVEISLGITF